MSKITMLRITSPAAKAKRLEAAKKRDLELRAIQEKMMKTPVQSIVPMPQEWKEARDKYIKDNNLPF